MSNSTCSSSRLTLHHHLQEHRNRSRPNPGNLQYSVAEYRLPQNQEEYDNPNRMDPVIVNLNMIQGMDGRMIVDAEDKQSMGFPPPDTESDDDDELPKLRGFNNVHSC